MTNAEVSEKKRRPILTQLHVAEEEGGEDYLKGYKCRDCGEAYLGLTDHRTVCIKCDGRNLEPLKFAGDGEVFTYTIVPTPYNFSYIGSVVKLVEGPLVRANVVDCDEKDVKVGMKVKMFTEKHMEDKAGNDVITYRFRPA